MVSTTDGRATLDGRSGPISDDADRALFHGLRMAVDAVLVGAGTVRTERYGRLIPDESRRRLRRERGLPDEPLACIVSGRLALDADIPLLAEPSARVAILTSSAASLPGAGAHVDYVRAGAGGAIDLAAGLEQLRERFDVHTVLCEGGPHLGYQLLAHGSAGRAVPDALADARRRRAGGRQRRCASSPAASCSHRSGSSSLASAACASDSLPVPALRRLGAGARLARDDAE